MWKTENRPFVRGREGIFFLFFLKKEKKGKEGRFDDDWRGTLMKLGSIVFERDIRVSKNLSWTGIRKRNRRIFTRRVMRLMPVKVRF